MSFTCNGCANRTPGCHNKCEKYQKEKAEYDARKEKANKDKAIQQSLYTQKVYAIGKQLKSHGRKFTDSRG